MFARNHLCLLASLVLLCSSLAKADTVILTNGNEFEGEIQEDSKRRVVIKVRGGVMTFPRRLVEKVIKSAPKKKKKKKKARRRSAPAGKIDPGAPSYWTENKTYAQAGEVWHFKLAPVSEPKPGSEHERITPKASELRVERVGLFGLQFARRVHYRAREKPQSYWDSFMFTARGAHPRRGGWSEWRSDMRAASGAAPTEESQRFLQYLAKAPTRKLTLAGREFTCKLVTLVKPRRKRGAAPRAGRWAYVHYAEGKMRWPGLLKEQRGKKVLQVLTKIDPPPPGLTQPPVRPWAKPGDWVKVRLETGEFKRVVTRVCPTEVEMNREDGTRPTIWRFNPTPVAKQSFPRWRPSKRRHVTVGGKRLLCQEFVDTDNPKVFQLVRISEAGHELWPGVIKDIASSTIFEEVIEIRSSR